MADWWDIVKTGADIVLSGGKAYLDYKSKKKQNEMIQKSYDDYMAQQKEAAKVAQRAVSTNLTPMTVFNKPSTKADVTDFTAVKDGGIMNLKNGSRPTYQEGIGPLVEQVSMQEDVSEVPAGGDMPPELAELIRSLHAEHYERLKAMGKTDEEIMKILMDMAMSMIQADAQGKTPEGMGVEVQAEEMIDVKNGGIMGLRKGGRSNYRSQGIVTESITQENEIESPPQDEVRVNDMLLGSPDYQGGITTSDIINPTRTDEDVQAARADIEKSNQANQIQETATVLIEELILPPEEALEGAHKINAVEKAVPGASRIALMLIKNQLMDVDSAIDAAVRMVKSSQIDQSLAQGGIIGLRKGGRSNYRSQGFVDEDEDIEVMDPESLGDYELKMEEGVDIGPMATGPSDKYEAQIQKLMQEMNISRELAEALILGSDPASVDFLKNLRKGGIAGLRQGGRIGYSEGSWEAEWDRLYNDYKAKQIELGKEFVSKEEFIDMHRDNNAQGGRVQRYGGGVMDLGGIEKDYRTTGGFVDIGGRERADDVPARLSRNEFVMTADAVRAAGGGSINKGAQRMYNVMKHLETKGAAA